MDDYDTVVIIIFFLSFISAVVSGMVTVGDAILFHIFYRAAVAYAPDLMHSTPLGSNDLELSVLLMSLRTFVLQPMMTFMWRKDIRWDIVPYMVPLQGLFVMISSYILFKAGSAGEEATVLLQRFVASVFTLTSIYFGVVQFRRVVAKAKERSAAKENRANNLKVAAGVVVVGFNAEDGALEEEKTMDNRHDHASQEVELDVHTAAVASTAAEEQGAEAATTASVTVATEGAVTADVAAAADIDPSKIPLSELSTDSDEYSRRIRKAFIIASPIAGFLTGLSNVGAPPFFVVLLVFQTPKSISKGVMPLAFMAGIIIRVVFTTIIGGYNWAAWKAIVAMQVGGVLGILLGDRIGSIIDDRIYLVVMCWLLFFAAVALLGIPLWMDLVLMVAAGGSIAYVRRLMS